MGPSESSSQSSRVPKSCGRASEVWSGARSALFNLGIQHAHRVAFGRSARSKKKQKANDFPGRTNWPHHTGATHRNEPGGPAAPPSAPAATVWLQGADPWTELEALITKAIRDLASAGGRVGTRAHRIA
jgi:hypothetical protein